MDGCGKDRLHFVPALPAMGRVTVNGVHYIEGVPVAESVFGTDPFEPVRHSDIGEIISGQTKTPVHRHGDRLPPEGAAAPGIHLYDAQREETLERLAGGLKEAGELFLTAGCAGFAAVLPKLLKLRGRPSQPRKLPPPLLVVCGSVNPMTRLQLEEAERGGFTRLQLTPEQKLDPEWLCSGDCGQVVEAWAGLAASRPGCILDSNDHRPGETLEYARMLGLTREQLRVRVSTVLGVLLKRLLDRGVEGTLLLTGGDTLLAFMRQIGVGTLIPDREVAPGAVLSHFSYRGKSYHVISKSGGFGKRGLLSELAGSIAAGAEEKEEKIC